MRNRREKKQAIRFVISLCALFYCKRDLKMIINAHCILSVCFTLNVNVDDNDECIIAINDTCPVG